MMKIDAKTYGDVLRPLYTSLYLDGTVLRRWSIYVSNEGLTGHESSSMHQFSATLTLLFRGVLFPPINSSTSTL